MRSLVVAGVVAVAAAGAVWLARRHTPSPSPFPKNGAGGQVAAEDGEVGHAREGMPLPPVFRQDRTRPRSPFDRERDTFSKVPVEASHAIARGGRHAGIAITSTTKDVLVTLIQMTDRQTGRGRASYGQIAAAASCGKTSVVRHMRILDEHFGYIRRAHSHKINPSKNTVTAWTLAGVVQSVVCHGVRNGRATTQHGGATTRNGVASGHENGGERINGVASDESALVTLLESKRTTSSSSSLTDSGLEGVGVQDDDPPGGDLYDQMRAKHGSIVDDMLARAENDKKVADARGFVAAAFRDGYYATYMAKQSPAAENESASSWKTYADERKQLYWDAHEAGLVADFRFNGFRDYTVEELEDAIENGTPLRSVEETASPEVVAPGWWQMAHDQLRLQFDQASFDTWLRDATFISEDGETVVVQVRNAYARDMLQHRLYRNVQRVYQDVRGEPVEIEFIFDRNSALGRTS